MNKRSLILSCILFILTTGGVMGIMLFWHGQNDAVIEQGSKVADIYGQRYYLLQGAAFDEESGHWYFSFQTDEFPPEGCRLALMRTRNFRFYRQGELYAEYSAGDYKRIRVIRLDEAFYDEGRGTVRFEWDADTWFLGYNLFLIPKAETMESMESLYYTIRIFGIGMLLLLLIQNLSLFFCKRDEHYVLDFALFVAALLLMALINSVSNISYSLSGTFLAAVQLLLSVKTSFQLLDMKAPGFWGHVNSWHGIILISILYSMAANTGNVYVSEGLQLVFMAYGAVVLHCACGLGKRNSWILLLGYAVKVGMNAMPILTNWNVVSEWLDFAMFRTVKLFELPFAFTCMFCINRRFADKFKESERLGAELIALNQALDKKVQERTEALLENQEQRRNMMLNIFHDLRSPLFAVKGCTDILPVESPQSRELLATIRDRLQFLIHLTEQLFLAAKLEDKQIRLEKSPYDMGEVLTTLAESCRLEAEKKGVRLLCHAEQKRVLNGDIFRIQQAFQNIITNAICFTPQGGRVCIQLEALGQGGARVLVEDTGKGIGPGEIHRIFTRYYRVEDNEKRASSGLGLSIAKEIIEQHGGSIRAESEPGKGTRFIVDLPLLEE